MGAAAVTRGGVIIVPCPNRAPPAKGARALAVARRYHFLCPDDHAVLPVLDVAGAHSTRLAERRIRFGLCPTCGFKWSGPRIGELPADRSLFGAFNAADQTIVEKEEQTARKFGIGGQDV